MCTLTVIPLRSGSHGDPVGYRVATNRDESRMRAPALAPRPAIVSGVRALWPVDGHAGGTWIAANDRGVTLSLLNVNLSRPPALPQRPKTRGAIIPALSDAATAQEAGRRLQDSELAHFAPFRMVAFDVEDIIEVRWDGDRVAVRRSALAPACFVSSGLGDHLVEPRLGLFASLLADGRLTPEDQDAFHRHVWADRPEISVMMSRADARTVSTTIVEANLAGGAAAVVMTHMDDSGRHVSELAREAGRRRATPVVAAPC